MLLVKQRVEQKRREQEELQRKQQQQQSEQQSPTQHAASSSSSNSSSPIATGASRTLSPAALLSRSPPPLSTSPIPLIDSFERRQQAELDDAQRAQRQYSRITSQCPHICEEEIELRHEIGRGAQASVFHGFCRYVMLLLANVSESTATWFVVDIDTWWWLCCL
jgi:hypothetical protein